MTKPIPGKRFFKSASIENVDDEFPGTFRVVLSAPTKDRDGDTLLPEEWQQPLPEHITFDIDHGMSVMTTVGSGVPSIDDAGRLIVDGTYSSLALAQDTRTLVKEGHIKTTSVAFMTVPSSKKDGKTVRELLNGAFVSVPSNREALVLESKSATSKVGARNSSTDAERIQQIHDLALELGASPEPPADAAAAEKRANARGAQYKSIDGSLEQLQDRIRDELRETYLGWVWLRDTVPAGTDLTAGYVVFDVEDPDTYDSDTYRESFTYDGSTVTLAGDRQAVEVTEQVIPDPDAKEDAAATPAAAEAPASAAAGKAAAAELAAEMKVRADQVRSFLTVNNIPTPEGSTT